MLTVAYCRVSTEDQAAEGFSIDGQMDKLRAYAQLRDLGPVTVISDPGRSGKDLDRPGLQRLLDAVEQGHVAHVLIWRLDRLSRSLGDLIDLADRFGKAGVGLHSFSEQLDLSSATGRMFYGILGTFAQFYREQLSENVRMGMQQAARQGRWTNRPKTGYHFVDGRLVQNDDAPIVRQTFRLRAEGKSYRDIEAATGIKYSTVMAILKSRIYLGEVLNRGDWFPGEHEPIITTAEFDAAQRGQLPGRRRSTHILGGRVRCGLCGKAATVQYNPDGLMLFRCRHRGQGCPQPGRSSHGLERAVVLGMRLVGTDENLREAIRQELRGDGRPARQGGDRTRRPAAVLAELSTKRRKLLELYYADRISPDLFHEEETRLHQAIAATQADLDEKHQAVEQSGRPLRARR